MEASYDTNCDLDTLLLQQNHLVSLRKPDAWILKCIQNFLHNDGLSLSGPDAEYYGSVLKRKGYRNDLVHIHQRPNPLRRSHAWPIKRFG